jgi:hypothetical protein
MMKVSKSELRTAHKLTNLLMTTTISSLNINSSATVTSECRTSLLNRGGRCDGDLDVSPSHRLTDVTSHSATTSYKKVTISGC